MNKTFVASLENHDVYYVSTDKVSFYFNISKKKENTNITLDIKTKKRNSLNDIVRYYEKIDNYNITLVVPTIKMEEDQTFFKYQCNLISNIINCAHKFLTSNDIVVNNNINVIKHSTRSDFVDFFVNKFESRVRYLNLDKLVYEEVPYNKVNAASISFVVGKPELEVTFKEDEMKDIINEAQEKKNEMVNTKPKYNFATSGFVSYYLLGFLTAVLTLLGLTLLIKWFRINITYNNDVIFFIYKN